MAAPDWRGKNQILLLCGKSGKCSGGNANIHGADQWVGQSKACPTNALLLIVISARGKPVFRVNI